MNIEQLESYNLADAVKFHNKLNPKLWDSSEHLKPEIREQLLLIAEDFAQSLGVKDLQLVDITISGSNAAYTYTKHSDIDLHLVVDIPELNDEVYRELFNAKKTIYNSEHNIKIKGIEVELYVEPAGERPVSHGIYSVLNQVWIIIPKRRRATIDDMTVRSKYDDISKRIRKAIKSKSEKEMTHLLHKIRELRQAGLAQQGEFGPENLAFKMLRSQGDIEQLRNARADAKSRELSLKEKQTPTPVTYGYGEDFVAEVSITPDGTNPTTCQFTNEDEQLSNEDILRDFINFCVEELQLEKMPVIKLRKDPQWSVVNKTFGRYNNLEKILEVAWGKRHIMDVLRTVAHELTHARQHEREELPDTAGDTGSPFENEANARAGILMRDYAKLHPDFFSVGKSNNLDESTISETAQDERFLQQIGNAVERWAEKFKATSKQKMTGFVQPGKLGEITGIKGETDAQKHLLNLGMMFLLLPKDVGGKHPLGAYRPAKGEWGGDIGADIRYLIPDATLSKSKAGQEFTHTLKTHENDLASTVAHELRHALDDYLSKGKYDSSAHKYDYYDQTVEINAFFTQALKSLQQMIDDDIVDESNLQWAIRRVFYNNELISNLIANNDPRVKRLFSRAYTYFKSKLDRDLHEYKETKNKKTHRLNDANSNLNILHNRKNYQQTLQVLQTGYGDEEGQQMLDQYIRVVDQLIHSGGTVYRGIWVAPGTKPRLKDAGQHWALTAEAAEEYLDSDAGWGAYADFQGDNDDIQPEPYIISATVGPNSITNKGVLFAQFPEELEVRLVNPQTAKMKIIKKAKGLVPESRLNEASGYIPTAAEAHDPRFEMALTVDVHPGAIGKAANAFLLNTDSQGHPQELRADGMVKRMLEDLELFKRNYQ